LLGVLVEPGDTTSQQVDVVDIDRPVGQRGTELGQVLDGFRPLEWLQCLGQRDPGGVGEDLFGEDPWGLVGEFVEASSDSERTRFDP
jgi:hypothetical protein